MIGFPLERPTLYSFNSFIPCMPTHFSNTSSVMYVDKWKDPAWLKCMSNERNRLYGKNGKTTYVREYSDFSTNDFVCGARLGGANFSFDAAAGYEKGNMKSPLKAAKSGLGLSLPDV